MGEDAPASELIVAALYKFVELPDFADLRSPLLEVCRATGVYGTLLLAREGVNGTIAGPDAGIAAVLAHLRADPRLSDLDVKFSTAREMPFHRMKVRLKREIVTMGAGDVDPVRNAGAYVKPEDWNALIADPEVLLIDTRNDYEVDIGTFEGAVDPGIASFTEFPGWVEKLIGELKDGRRPKVAMFCTGGIRCEKASAHMRAKGFEEVYHLKGGILKYLETLRPDESRWRGDCFVFDERVAVGHGLAIGDYELCRACRRPVGAEERASPKFERGVSCPACHDHQTPAQRARFVARREQVERATARGEKHVGVDFSVGRADR